MDPTHAGIAVIARDTGRLLMIQRAWDETDPEDVRGTWEFPGGSLEVGETPEDGAWREFCEETGCPTPVGEMVNGWTSPDGVYQGFVYAVPVEAEAFVEINPDAEATDTINPDDPQRLNPDITAWFTVDQLRGLGAALRPEVVKMDWSVFDLEANMTETQPQPVAARKWFGVMAPEGVKSGDGRGFTSGSLRMRSLPLPMTWQKVADAGHKGNITTGIIQEVWRDTGLIWFAGEYLDTPEADEHFNLVDKFGRYGVSVDADDLDEFSIEMDEEGVTWFTDARACSACAVSIPAFAEAWMMNGDYATFATEFAGGWGTPSQEIPTRDNTGQSECQHRDADGNCLDRVTDEKQKMPYAAEVEARDVSTDERNQRAKDGTAMPDGGYPIANCDDLKNAIQAIGRAKDPGKTKNHIRKRKSALGCDQVQIPDTWALDEPNQGEGIAMTASTTTPTFNGVVVGDIESEVISLTAGAPMKDPPKMWFDDPGLPGVTPLTVTNEGRVFGHLATWGQCHVGFKGECVMLPRSKSDYSYFHIGTVETDGGQVFTGPLVMGGKHAPDRIDWRAATRHYDTTSAVVADLCVGEDEFGVWMSGAMRDGVTDEQVRELKAAGKASGDWREVVRGSRQLELICGLVVNVGGFPVPRARISVNEGRVVSLVAAGIVTDDPIGDITEEVIARIEAKQSMRALRAEVYGGQMAVLRAEIED